MDTSKIIFVVTEFLVFDFELFIGELRGIMQKTSTGVWKRYSQFEGLNFTPGNPET